MATSVQFLLLLPLILLISKASSLSHSPILPKAATFPVSKDPSTLQYVARLFMGENLDSVNLVVDLNGPSLWIASELKSTSQPIKSSSLKCSMAKSINGCGARYNSDSHSCTLMAENTVSRMSKSGDLSEDVIAMEFWDGIGSSSFAKSEKFLLLSSPNLLLNGLAHDARGMLGLGDSRISLPSQFYTTFGFFDRKFSLCLSHIKGAVFLGGSPQISTPMMFTPLISNKNEPFYQISVSSIRVSNKKLQLQEKLYLDAKISTIAHYTTFESQIYAQFVESYVSSAVSMNMSLVQPVAPFEVCFGLRDMESVPIVELVLQSELVKWRIHGEKSMVVVSDEVMCLGFLDGGVNPRVSIVVGGYQIEDHMLEFNLGNSMLGFASLVKGEEKCSDFEASSMDMEMRIL